jgi:DNA-binding transcriptional LysR family regulator
VSSAELNDTPLVSRETGSGTREALSTALRATLGSSSRQADPAIELSSAAAMRAAVLAGAGPAVMSRLAVDDDLTLGRLREIPISGLDLRRDLRAIWSGGRTPPAGAVRELLAHIASHGRE